MTSSPSLAETARARRTRALVQSSLKRELISAEEVVEEKQDTAPVVVDAARSASPSSVSPFTGRACFARPSDEESDVKAVFREEALPGARGIILTRPEALTLSPQDALPACTQQKVPAMQLISEPLSYTPPPRNLAASLLLLVQ